MIKVLVVDDHDLVRTGITRMLADIDGLQVIEQLTDGARHRIGHVFADAVGIETDLLGHGLALGLHVGYTLLQLAAFLRKRGAGVALDALDLLLHPDRLVATLRT